MTALLLIGEGSIQKGSQSLTKANEEFINLLPFYVQSTRLQGSFVAKVQKADELVARQREAPQGKRMNGLGRPPLVNWLAHLFPLVSSLWLIFKAFAVRLKLCAKRRLR